MSKYFTQQKDQQIRLSDYEKKLQEGTLDYHRIKYLQKYLGDVELSEGMIKMYFNSFNSRICKYGTVCLTESTIVGLYDIIKSFPMLTPEALSCISKEYIQDLFEDYKLKEKLYTMIWKDGCTDETFEAFMTYVKTKAKELDEIYLEESSKIKLHFNDYGTKFVEHFEKFNRQHHVTFSKFECCIPEIELISKDEAQLKKISLKARECWGFCDPISYQMLESYLDSEESMQKYPEQPAYFISNTREEIPTTFTKTEFLGSMQKESQKTLEKK